MFNKDQHVLIHVIMVIIKIQTKFVKSVNCLAKLVISQIFIVLLALMDMTLFLNPIHVKLIVQLMSIKLVRAVLLVIQIAKHVKPHQQIVYHVIQDNFCKTMFVLMNVILVIISMERIVYPVIQIVQHVMDQKSHVHPVQEIWHYLKQLVF